MFCHNWNVHVYTDNRTMPKQNKQKNTHKQSLCDANSYCLICHSNECIEIIWGGGRQFRWRIHVFCVNSFLFFLNFLSFRSMSKGIKGLLCASLEYATLRFGTHAASFKQSVVGTSNIHTKWKLHRFSNTIELTLNSLLSLIRSCARMISPIFGRPSNAILSLSVKSSGAFASASVIAFANSSS